MKPPLGRIMFYLWLILFIGLIAWHIWGYFSSRVEQAAYEVLERRPAYEIRRYAPHIEARVEVKGPPEKALNDGFRILAGYIFGGNTKRQRVAMTAPVLRADSSPEKIPMTAPVTAQARGDAYTIAFVMPSRSTLDTLPSPHDSRIELIEVPERAVAAIRFSGSYSDKRIRKYQGKLATALKADGVVTVGEPYFAGYNAPWTPPWMMRNEVLCALILP